MSPPLHRFPGSGMRPLAERDDLCAGLRRAGQSLWLEELERRALATGRLRALIGAGSVTGLTSHPSVTAKAVAANLYGEELRSQQRAGSTPAAALAQLQIGDARAGAALLAAVFATSCGGDGFVSVDVDPALAGDRSALVEAGRELHRLCGAPNVLVKIPATPAGLRAVTELTDAGIGTNVILLFSCGAVERAEHAYVEGLRSRAGRDQPVDTVASVASLSVSELDMAVDARLTDLDSGRGELAQLRGQAAIAVATLAWKAWRDAGSATGWRALADAGAHRQRLVFTSTSVQVAIYPATRYVRALVYRDTVTTLRLPTLSAALAERWSEAAAAGSSSSTPDARPGEAPGRMSIEAAQGCVARLRAARLDLEHLEGELEGAGLGGLRAAQREAERQVAMRLASG